MAEHNQIDHRLGHVITADGTTIGYRQLGAGPGLLILHGGGRASQHYLGLATLLADTYTVSIPDRRGRGLSGPIGPGYDLRRACEDVQVLMEATGAELIFGHSGGAMIALEAALRLPIAALMLYEPPVSIGGSLPLGWFPPFEQAIAQNAPADAMALFLKGLDMNWMSNLPRWLLVPFFRLMLQGQEGAEIVELLKTVGPEMQMIMQLESAHERYRDIEAKTLLLNGSRSPAFLRDVLPKLAALIPQAIHRELPGLDHSAPEEEGARPIAAELRRFLQAEPLLAPLGR